jgi:hypothetical protein
MNLPGHFEKQNQWTAFIQKGPLSDGPMEFPNVMEVIRDFLHPIVLANGKRMIFSAKWPAGGPWENKP